MSESLKKLRIFAASPSDVTSERAKLETVVKSLKPMADYLGLTLEVVDWRAVVPDIGRPEQIIFDQLKPTSWDIFIGILWHRFGTPPGAKDKTGKEYLSGTEEEFKTAYELWKLHGKPRIMLYRCTRGLPYDVDPDQLKRVREFFNFEYDYPTLYQAFDTTEAFEKLLLDNLQKLLIEYGLSIREVAEPLKREKSLPKYTVFISHATNDLFIARAISKEIKALGAQTWLDDQNLESGGVLVDEVINGLRNSQEAVILLSADSVKSQWVNAEIGAVLGLGKKVTPLLINVPYDTCSLLKNRKAIHVNDLDRYLDELRARIQ